MSHESLSLTYKVQDKIVNYTELVLEKRHPGQNVLSQMIKSPDIILLEGLALGVSSVILPPIELATWIHNKLSPHHQQPK